MVIYHSTNPAIAIPNIDLFSFIFAPNDFNRIKDVNKPLAIEGETGKSLSWTDIRQQSCFLATGWTQHVGLKQGDTVAVFAPNQLNHSVLYLSLLGAKCTISPGNPGYTEGKKNFFPRVSQILNFFNS